MPIILNELNHPFLSTAIQATNAGADVLKSYFRKSVAIEVKGKSNFVSQADLESQTAIVKTIHDAYPNHQITAEEGLESSVDCEHLWIIDPLDGTSNFLHRIPHFAISVAYLHYGKPELGIVYNPITDDVYSSVLGQGAYWNRMAIKVNDEPSLDETMIAVGFYYDRGKMMERTLAAIATFFRSNVHGVRRFGAAALDLANVARGDYGLFFEYQLHPWDYAAGGLILTEAGGQITDCFGKPIQFQTASSILATNGHLHAASLEITQRHDPSA